MAFEQINRGATANDGTGDNLREAFRKVNDNFDKALEEVTTSGVERAYTINADGSQGTKPTSEFKDVLEFVDLASFPVTGETEKIYLALDTNLQYRWSGSAYVQIGGGKRTQTVEFAINQIIAGSTNWYSFLTLNANINTAGLAATNASLTPTNDFANMSTQTPCRQVNFTCKIKNARFRGLSNSASTNIRVCIVKSLGNSVSLIANPDIIADKTFNTHNPSVDLCRQNFTGADLNTSVTIDEGSEIRFFLFNNNVASNLYSSLLTIEFEEI